MRGSAARISRTRLSSYRRRASLASCTGVRSTARNTWPATRSRVSVSSDVQLASAISIRGITRLGLAGAESLPPPTTLERVTLERVQADDTARLACQVVPTASLRVERLVDPWAQLDAVHATPALAEESR